jgi:hypothetical protein
MSLSGQYPGRCPRCCVLLLSFLLVLLDLVRDLNLEQLGRNIGVFCPNLFARLLLGSSDVVLVSLFHTGVK